ncbi:MAG TPA: ScpA family protein [Acidimicrobiales bacterium]|nr:ScpA family protein [Acidimicrobiales bacterium]
MAYEVRTPVFEGPFDLLLHLIVRDQVDVYEVSVADIVEAYLAHLQGLDHLTRADLEVATEFLLVAAVLIELKARRLLPRPEVTEPDEELALWEERDLFLARLLECRTFKAAGRAIEALAAESARSLPRVAGMEERFIGLMPDVLAGVTPADMRAAFVAATSPKPAPQVDMDHVAPIRVSVREVADELVRELPHLGTVTFRGLTAHLEDRLAVVVRFLAVLELYKDGLVELDQAATFGDLSISWVAGGAPVPSAAWEA